MERNVPHRPATGTSKPWVAGRMGAKGDFRRRDRRAIFFQGIMAFRDDFENNMKWL